MEKTRRGAVIPVAMGWSDLGSWAALQQLKPADNARNSVQGQAVLMDCEGSYIHAAQGAIAAIGLHNMVVVAANDALLIAPRNQLDKLKPLLQLNALDQHSAFAHRPWGHFEQIDQGSHYQVKKLKLKPGGKISLQSHMQRAEHWVVVEGRATVTNGDQIYMLEQNQSTYIPANTVHRLENREATPLVVIEIQTGEALVEEDITRLEDIYNRIENR